MDYNKALQRATKQLLTKKAKLLAEIGELEAKLLSKKSQLEKLEKDNAVEELAKKIIQQEQERERKKLEKAKQQLEKQGYKIVEQNNTSDAGEY